MGRTNRFKQALGEGRTPVAMWVTTPWEGTMTVLGDAGADAAFVDLEHVSFGLSTAERLIVAAEAAGISPLVRVPHTDASTVSRLLDAGAHGIIFPQVESPEDAEHAVACIFYRPRGVRGWGGAHTRYARWRGAYAGAIYTVGEGDADVYNAAFVHEAQEFPAVLLLVETMRGVERINEIAHVEGVSGVIFGWGDFAVECGFDRSACRAAATAVHTAARRAGVATAVGQGDERFPGCFVVAGIDSLLMSAALGRAVDEAVRA